MKGRSEKGMVAVLAAIFLPFLLAGLGLVIDNGQALDMRRRLQAGADAGAIGGAHALRTGARNDLNKLVIDSVKRNGFTLSDTNITVWNPPKTGKQAGNTSYVEVYLEHDAPLFFMKALYEKPYKVVARSISGVLPWNYCMLVLDKTASNALSIKGNSYVDASKCGVQVNSSSSNAANSDGGAVFKSLGPHVVGGYSGSGYIPAPLTKQPAIKDPLEYLPAPVIGKCLASSKTTVKDTVTLDPGVYCGGIIIQAGAHVTFKPGEYVMKGGGLEIHGGATVIANEVMVYNTGPSYAPIEIGSGAIVTMTPPIDGTYKGILFFTDRTITGGKPNRLSANSDVNLTGTVYFPSTDVRVAGGADLATQKTLLIVNKLEMSGNIGFEVLNHKDAVNDYTTDAMLVY